MGAAGGLIGLGVQNFFGGLDMFENNRGKAASARRNAAAAEAEAAQAAADQHAKSQHSAMLAGIEQIKGEAEAEKRSRILAHDIGAARANMAANGLLADGSGGTFDDVLTSQAKEGAVDIAAINDTTALNVWNLRNQEAQYRANAKTATQWGAYKAGLYRSQAKQLEENATLGLMQTVSGVPASALRAVGINSFDKLASTWGVGMGAGVFSPFTYGATKGVGAAFGRK